jgi:hypothetical protein
MRDLLVEFILLVVGLACGAFLVFLLLGGYDTLVRYGS